MRRIVLLGLLCCAAALDGCKSHEMTGPYLHAEDFNSETVPAPKRDRCENYASAKTTYSQCLGFKTTVTEYLRKLSTGDTVCMEDGFGEDPGPNCKARGAVIDADPRGFLIEFRDPSTASKWKDYQGRKVFFENGALTEIYLREHGYE